MTDEYTRTTTIDRSPDEVFSYVSDVGNLPSYLPPIVEASSRPADEGTERQAGDVKDAQGVHLEGELRGQRFENEGWFAVDQDSRTMRWGAQTDRTYSGELSVSGDGDGSELRVTLYFEARSDEGEIQEQTGDRDPVEEAMEASLESIRRQVTGEGGKVTPPEPPPGAGPDEG